MLDVNQHLNNVVLPVGEHHTLSIAQYSADTFCEVALYERKTSRRVQLPRLYKDSDAVSYTTDNFHYVRAEDLAEIISTATEHVEALKNFDDLVEELSK
jgi:hypothetical protein